MTWEEWTDRQAVCDFRDNRKRWRTCEERNYNTLINDYVCMTGVPRPVYEKSIMDFYGFTIFLKLSLTKQLEIIHALQMKNNHTQKNKTLENAC